MAWFSVLLRSWVTVTWWGEETGGSDLNIRATRLFWVFLLPWDFWLALLAFLVSKLLVDLCQGKLLAIVSTCHRKPILYIRGWNYAHSLIFSLSFQPLFSLSHYCRSYITNCFEYRDLIWFLYTSQLAHDWILKVAETQSCVLTNGDEAHDACMSFTEKMSGSTLTAKMPPQDRQSKLEACPAR